VVSNAGWKKFNTPSFPEMGLPGRVLGGSYKLDSSHPPVNFANTILGVTCGNRSVFQQSSSFVISVSLQKLWLGVAAGNKVMEKFLTGVKRKRSNEPVPLVVNPEYPNRSREKMNLIYLSVLRVC
jgi:hypothetical protein